MTPTRSRTLTRAVVAPFVALATLGMVACGGDDSSADTTEAPSGEWDEARMEAAREEARGLLGMNEDDLPGDVRTARRGDEQFPLTTDLVPGRRTVELDDIDGSGFRVVTVYIEFEDGTNMFELEPG